MNLHELKAAISAAERGSLSDLGKVLRAITDGDVRLANGYVIASGTTAALIADPTGTSGDVDPEARAAIADIIDALQAFGIVATS